MKRTILCLMVIAASLILANDKNNDFVSPKVTFDTFINAVRERNMDLALLCFSTEIRNDIAAEWKNEDLPDSIWYEITAEETGTDEAVIEVTMWDDISDRKVNERIWFVPEEDGWKIVFEPPSGDDRGGFDTTKE
ncbi:hypothetical protein A2Y85_06215 [candidate division WOR-3 bacterium RBG_13_43_14]|uniref:DUF4878 domain-containing protein n=1 Tax=candidate division WOR-3 bacterium RBG_13_43_14 TaxID=1802590 RepID=A0A1F4UCH7_UNCW3|nr:MAG: hypothetical protein A2Y85_06215 [candidate division WOR-3 bacterium RBG_13_43_14]